MAEISAEVNAARAATEWLRAALPTLTPEDWQTPEACGIWSVAEVAAHLIWVADLYSDAVLRALVDDVGPPRQLVVPESPAVMPTRMAEIASIYHQDLGDGVGGALMSRAQVPVVLFERLAPPDWDRPAYHPGGVRPIRRLLAQYIVEVCVHGWDILHRPGREVALPAATHGPILDALPGYLRGRFVPSTPLQEPERYAFRLGVTVPEGVRLTVYGDRFEFESESDEAGSDAVLDMHPQTCVLLLLGRLSWQQALQAGNVVVIPRRDGAGHPAAWFGQS
jgi:uncharacterized protein (TIGR03083 family)